MHCASKNHQHLQPYLNTIITFATHRRHDVYREAEDLDLVPARERDDVRDAGERRDEHALDDDSTESSFAGEERTQTQTGDDGTGEYSILQALSLTFQRLIAYYASDPPGSLASPLEPLSTTATDPRVTRGHRAADEKWVPDSPRNRTLTLSIPTHQSTGVRGVNRQTEPVFADSDGIISHGARHEMDGGVRLAGGRPGEPESPADSERDPVTSAPRGEASGYIVILPPPYSSHFGEAL